jgi:YCII-related domain-containing protein
MAIFLVIRTQTGPAWDTSKPMEEQSLWPEHADYMDALTERGFFLFGGPTTNYRVPFAVSADDEAAIRTELARDPWHESHLVVESIEPWSIRLRSPLLGDRV